MATEGAPRFTRLRPRLGRTTPAGDQGRHGGKTLFVASTGGHLDELWRLADRIAPTSSVREWVTFPDPQTDSLLGREVVHRVSYVPPRGYGQLARNVAVAARILRRGGFDRIVSTGAAIALPYVVLGRLGGLECHYIESAARADGPSLTGALCAKVPGVRLYAQYAAWATGRWSHQGSLFDAYASTVREQPPARPRRVVVTLGTMRTYGFSRAVRRVKTLLDELTDGAPVEVLWQVGSTPVTGLGIEVRDRVGADELRDAIERADLVIAHGGVGSALTALDAGHCPVLLPRRVAHGEHVDDHQLMIAGELDRRGLAVTREVDDLGVDDLRAAMATRVLTRPGDVFRLAPR